MMKKFFKYLSIFLALLVVIFLIGPKVKFETPKLLDTEISADIGTLDEFVTNTEKKIADLKPGNAAKVVWANDSLKQKTEYSIVYLHGFSASEMEGNPIHRNFAQRYGCNLYLSRLEDHGRTDTNTFIHLTPDNYLQSAEDAVDIGKKLGEKVIVMGCSSGCTLALALAAAGEKIHSLILYSPNIDVFDPTSELLVGPWGNELAKLVMKGSYNHIKYDSLSKKYWNPTYHINGLFALKSLIKTYMIPSQFAQVRQPLFMGYYYKDVEHQDKVVSVKRMLEFFDQVATPAPQKRKIAFPEAASHVISSSIKCKEIAHVETETYRFAEEILGLKPIVKK